MILCNIWNIIHQIARTFFKNVSGGDTVTPRTPFTTVTKNRAPALQNYGCSPVSNNGCSNIILMQVNCMEVILLLAFAKILLECGICLQKDLGRKNNPNYYGWFAISYTSRSALSLDGSSSRCSF